MNREQYISILEIEVAELKKEKKQLIKYLEDKIKYYSNLDSVNCNIRSDVYKDLLKKVGSSQYE